MKLPRVVLRPAALLLAAAAVSLPAGPAAAQLGEAAGFQRAMVPDFFRRDLELFAQDLELDESQRIILEQMLEDYQASFDSGTQNMIRKLQEMLPDLQGGDQRRIMQIVFEPLVDWYEDKLELRDRFLRDVHDILLSPEQQQRWPAFERQLLRQKTLQNGVLSGESTDLLLVLKTMDLDPQILQSMQPTIEAYEVALDAALRRRTELELESFRAMTKAIQSENLDSALTLVDRQISSHVAVRDVNMSYIPIMAQALPGGTAGHFERDALKRSFPRVFNDTPVMRMFEAARALPDLPPETVAAIEDLLGTYLSELEIYNDQLVRKTMSTEIDRERVRAENYAARKRGGTIQRQPDRLREEFKKREEFGNTYVQLLQSLLTEEQFASLPGASRWLRRTTGVDAARAKPDGVRSKLEQVESIGVEQNDGGGLGTGPKRGKDGG